MTPDKFTISETFLDVGDGHQLYVQDWGNPKAKTPIIYLHGGPGSHCKDKYKAVFEPSAQRVIFFDQRGCGNSTPYGSLKLNTTDKLVGDIVKIIKHYNLPACVITGGSWGSTLALCFAIAHPKKVKALVINGILTGRQQELSWLDKGLFKTFMPDVWQAYCQTVPKAHQNDPSQYHFKRILSNDAKASKASAYAYNNLEGAVLSLDDRYLPGAEAEFDPSNTKIEVHYLANKFFIPENHVFGNVAKLTMPVWMIHGRYDMVCPPITAYELDQKLSNSHLIWTISGHILEHEAWNLNKTILGQLTS